MSNNSKQRNKNRDPKKEAILTGLVLLLVCFLFGKKLNSVHESITVVLFIAMLVSFAVSYLLPSKGQKVHDFVPDGDTEGYLDKDLKDPTKTFSQREQKNIQKYSWMSRVEYFNRHRRI